MAHDTVVITVILLSLLLSLSFVVIFVGHLCDISSAIAFAINMFICLEEGRYQYVSMVVICNASDVIECDRRKPELAV
tara:strand:- start:122 stop:355 length:234 start_codon:yes stop_codon:yes gene_type:complete